MDGFLWVDWPTSSFGLGGDPMPLPKRKPGEAQTDGELFTELVDAIFKAPEWSEWHQDVGAAIEVSEPIFKLKGLLRIDKGEREWWPYTVDMKRLRREGVKAIERDFFAGYRKAREAARRAQ